MTQTLPFCQEGEQHLPVCLGLGQNSNPALQEVMSTKDVSYMCSYTEPHHSPSVTTQLNSHQVFMVRKFFCDWHEFNDM